MKICPEYEFTNGVLQAGEETPLHRPGNVSTIR
jgi:hypothetical protein